MVKCVKWMLTVSLTVLPVMALMDSAVTAGLQQLRSSAIITAYVPILPATFISVTGATGVSVR